MQPKKQGKVGTPHKPNTGAARGIYAAIPPMRHADPLVHLASIALRVAQKKSAHEVIHAAA